MYQGYSVYITQLNLGCYTRLRPFGQKYIVQHTAAIFLSVPLKIVENCFTLIRLALVAFGKADSCGSRFT